MKISDTSLQKWTKSFAIFPFSVYYLPKYPTIKRYSDMEKATLTK